MTNTSSNDESISIAELLDNYSHEEAAELAHEAAKTLHGELCQMLNSNAVETAARETGKLIERALPRTLTPYEMAAFCITTYFAALPIEFPLPPKRRTS